VARERILENIRQSLGSLDTFIPEAIRTFEAETGKPLSFANFVDATELTPLQILRTKTWSEWKNLAYSQPEVQDPDLDEARKALRRVSLRTDPALLNQVIRVSDPRVSEDAPDFGLSEKNSAALHYLLWGKKGGDCGIASCGDSFAKWRRNRFSNSDMIEVAKWRQSAHPYPTPALVLTEGLSLNLHAAYGFSEIKAIFGVADISSPGPTGVGVIHLKESKTYIHLVTFRKEEKDFSPTTRYKDYLISRSRLHWETQAATTQASNVGQNYINFKERGYTVLFFARTDKRIEGETSPFTFLGSASDLLSFEGNRPISMVWELQHPVPAALFEAARVG
jgi:hypothetical protein